MLDRRKWKCRGFSTRALNGVALVIQMLRQNDYGRQNKVLIRYLADNAN